MNRDRTLAPKYFEDVYAADPDPWRFETSAYERDKYAHTLSVLPKARYARGFEIGCSIGVLTNQLAERCDSLLAVDVSVSALERARARCREQPQVEFARLAFPDRLPGELFDLIVVSEVAYYWSRADLARASRWMSSHLRPGGTLVLVHWTAHVPDYPLTGGEVHAHFAALAADGCFAHVLGESRPEYRIDVFGGVDTAAQSMRGLR